MKFRPTTAATLADDLSRFSTYLTDPDTPEDLLVEISAWLNKKLDQLHNQDAFGTEGQCDPRGDHRR